MGAGRYAVHELCGEGAGADAPVVLATHGITANGYWYLPLARELRRRGSGLRLLAACLRGRADSFEVGGPYGLDAHARDLVEVSTLLGIRPVLLGHSMGAFVAALAMAGSPHRFGGVVLADGGVMVPTPAGIDRDAAVRRVLRPALRRLRLRFADADAYVADWGSHPALRGLATGPDAGLLRDVALHDAVPVAAGAGVRSAVEAAAVEADGRDVAGYPATSRALAAGLALGKPAELVWARRGLYDEPVGFYDEARLAALAPTGLRATGVEDANHLSLVLARPGVGVIADALERACGRLNPSGQPIERPGSAVIPRPS